MSRLNYYVLYGFCVCLCFVVHYFVPFQVLQSLEVEERAGSYSAFIVIRMSCYCKCSVTLPHDAVGWSAVCACGIS